MKIKKQKITLDVLAGMVASGFENTPTKAEFNELKTDVSILKTDVQMVQADLSDVKLRLDYLAPKFEVRDLEKRVTRLEQKAGLRNLVTN